MSRREAFVFLVLGLLGPAFLLIGNAPVHPSSEPVSPAAMGLATAIGLFGWIALVFMFFAPTSRRGGPRSALGLGEMLVALLAWLAAPLLIVAFVSPYTAAGLVAVMVANLLVAGALLLYAESTRRARRPDADPLFGRPSRRVIGIGALMMFASLPAVNSASAITSAIIGGRRDLQDIIERMLDPSTPGVHVALFVVLGVIVAPVLEEIVFRGFVQGALRRPLGRWGAIVVSGVAFGAIHEPLAAKLPLALLGVVLGMIHDRTRTLAGPMIAHAIFNSINVAVILVQRGGQA